MNLTTETVGFHPANDGWQVHHYTLNADGTITRERGPLAGWLVKQDYTADSQGEPVDPLPGLRVEPAYWTYGEGVTEVPVPYSGNTATYVTGPGESVPTCEQMRPELERMSTR